VQRRRERKRRGKCRKCRRERRRWVVVKREKVEMAVGAAVAKLWPPHFFSVQRSTWSPTERKIKKDVSPCTVFGGEFHRKNNNGIKLSI
jgi:ribosomal protein S8E